MCAIMKWKLYYLANNTTLTTFFSLCMMFLLLEMIATMNSTITNTCWFVRKKTNELMLRITTKCK